MFHDEIVTMLAKSDIQKALKKWYKHWNSHNLEGVMSLLHDDILFESWAGTQVRGKSKLKRLWKAWFAQNRDFQFEEKETFIDVEEQKVLFRWILTWPSMTKEYDGITEKREGVDVLHFLDGKIIRKLTFSKTFIEVDNQIIQLVPKLPCFSESITACEDE